MHVHALFSCPSTLDCLLPSEVVHLCIIISSSRILALCFGLAACHRFAPPRTPWKPAVASLPSTRAFGSWLPSRTFAPTSSTVARVRLSLIYTSLTIAFADQGYYITGRRGVDYENVLADSEREAVTDLLNFLENRQETDFFTGGPLNALSTLVYSHNIDLQRSASLTFAEITERGASPHRPTYFHPLRNTDLFTLRCASRRQKHPRTNSLPPRE